MKVLLVALLVLLLALGSVQHAYAAPLSVEDFCNPKVHEAILKGDYKAEVSSVNTQINNILTFSDKTPQDLAKVIDSPYLEAIGQKAACLKSYGIDPNSVAKFSSDAQEVFMAHYDKLKEVAPTLVQHVTVPEYGAVAQVLAVSVVTSMIILRRFRHR